MRLFTYNIHKAIGGRDRRYRLERIVEVIEAQNPDLICLQEVARGTRRSRFDDQPRVLAKHFCSAICLFQSTVRYRYGGYGNLFLSRWPVVRMHQISLRKGQKKPRGAQLAVVQSPEGPVHVANCHLGLAEAERQWQASHLLDHRFFGESSHLPTLVAGDTNDWRNRLASPSFADRNLVQVTHPASRFRTFPAWMPIGSLDKVFVNKGIRVRAAHVVRNRMARQASDHLPLVVDFHLSK